MSTPMWDMPEHLEVPVNADGQGPVSDAEADHYVCFCGTPGCTKYKEEEV